MLSRPSKLMILLLGPLVFGACADPVAPVAPAELPVLMRSSASVSVLPDLAVCPVREASAASAIIGPGGGELTHRGHRLSIDRGVLSRPTRFTITQPAGTHLRVQITASGRRHYAFRAPVSVTISYEGCQRQHRLAGAATAWYLPDNPNRPPEAMGGVIDRDSRSITFTTTHLSTYAVAY